MDFYVSVAYDAADVIAKSQPYFGSSDYASYQTGEDFITALVCAPQNQRYVHRHVVVLSDDSCCGCTALCGKFTDFSLIVFRYLLLWIAGHVVLTTVTIPCLSLLVLLGIIKVSPRCHNMV